MNFLGMGPLEVILIILLALLVFGPHKVPEISRGLGKAIRDFRRATSDVSRDLTRQIEEEVEASQQALEPPSAKAEAPPASFPIRPPEAPHGEGLPRP